MEHPDAWEQFKADVAAELERRVAVEVAQRERARPDDAHVAAEDVEELGQLIERGGSQEMAQLGDALLVGQVHTVLVAGIGHGAELHEAKRLVALAHALLAEQDGRTNGYADNQGQHQHRQAEHQQGEEGQENVQQSFETVFVHIA